MGTAFMTDEVNRLLGRLEQGFSDITRRLDDQDRQTETNKQEAIKRREEKEARDVARFSSLEEKATNTYGMASVSKKWIEEKGEPLVKRVEDLESRNQLVDKRETAAKNRRIGAAAVWGSIAAAVGGLATLVGFVGLEGIANALARLAQAMGAR